MPMHAQPLPNGNDAYATIPVSERKNLLISFLLMVRKLPIHYITFLYRKLDFTDLPTLGNRLKRDIINALFDHLNIYITSTP